MSIILVNLGLQLFFFFTRYVPTLFLANSVFIFNVFFSLSCYLNTAQCSLDNSAYSSSLIISTAVLLSSNSFTAKAVVSIMTQQFNHFLSLGLKMPRHADFYRGLEVWPRVHYFDSLHPLPVVETVCGALTASARTPGNLH